MNGSDFVVLKGGLTVPLDAVRFALDLESRGGQLVAEGDDILIGPSSLITDEDRQAVRRWRRHLHAILAYDEAIQ